MTHLKCSYMYYHSCNQVLSGTSENDVEIMKKDFEWP